MLNAQQLEGHWTEFKGRIQERWGALTESDLDQAEGNVDQLVGVIQRKTGEARSNIEDFLEELATEASTTLEKVGETARAYAGKAGDYAAQARDSARETYDQVSQRVHDGYVEAEEMVKTHPAQSVAVAFGTGLIAGVIVGLVFRSR